MRSFILKKHFVKKREKIAEKEKRFAAFPVLQFHDHAVLEIVRVFESIH